MGVLHRFILSSLVLRLQGVQMLTRQREESEQILLPEKDSNPTATVLCEFLGFKAINHKCLIVPVVLVQVQKQLPLRTCREQLSRRAKRGVQRPKCHGHCKVQNDHRSRNYALSKLIKYL